MDPFSITSACVGLLCTITSLTLRITRFAGDVRDSRKDLDAVRRELSSLSFCVESLRDDTNKDSNMYPDALKPDLVSVLDNCDGVMNEMTMLLEKSTSNNLGRRVQWAACGQDEMNKLRSKLEGYKATIELALHMASIYLASSIKQDTTDILADTQAIQQDTACIPEIQQDIELLLQKISYLEAQLARSQDDSGKAHILQRFMDNTTTYAESVLQPEDLDGATSINDDAQIEPVPPFPRLSRYTILLQKKLYSKGRLSMIAGSGDPEPSRIVDQPKNRQSLEQKGEEPNVSKIASPSSRSPKQTPVQMPTEPPILEIDESSTKTTCTPVIRPLIRSLSEPAPQLIPLPPSPLEPLPTQPPIIEPPTQLAPQLLLPEPCTDTLGGPDEQEVVRNEFLDPSHLVRFYRRTPKIDQTESCKSNRSSNSNSYPLSLSSPTDRGLVYWSQRMEGFDEWNFIAKLEELLENGGDINVKNGYPLRRAAHHLKSQVVRFILDHNGSEGLDLALNSAISQHECPEAVEIVQMLVDNGANLDGSTDLCPPLEYVTSNSHWHFATILVNGGAKSGIDAALHHAVNSFPESEAQYNLVDLLLGKGANVHHLNAADGPTVLQRAARYSSPRIVLCILEAGADVLQQGGKYGTALKAAKQRSRKENSRKSMIETIEAAEQKARVQRGLPLYHSRDNLRLIFGYDSIKTRSNNHTYHNLRPVSSTRDIRVMA